jgi:hypothetical protein
VNLDDLDRLEALEREASPAPWRDVTEAWNDSLNGINKGWHGKRTRRNSLHHLCMIVSEAKMLRTMCREGEADLLTFKQRGYPDYWDLKAAMVIGNPEGAFRRDRDGGRFINNLIEHSETERARSSSPCATLRPS